MTPYHTTPHASQTPRYGQTTPSGKSPFLAPGLPISAQKQISASPYQASPQTRNYSQSQENSSWQKASDAWGAGSRGSRPFGGPPQQPKEQDGYGSSPGFNSGARG